MREIKKNAWTPDNISNLNGRVYVITGANSGIGFDATKILLSKGAEVIMLNRSESKSKQAIDDIKVKFGNKAKVSFIKMDLAQLSSVKEASEQLAKKISRIDALICNAAIAQVPNQQFTKDGFESQLGVNHYGHFLLQGLLFPIIEKSKGRIVVVGSMGYNLGLKTMQFDDMNWDKNYNANSAYSQSKLAQIMSVYELQDKLKKAGNTNVKVYACHPGASSTSLIKTSGSLMTRIAWKLMTLTPLVQSAEKGSYPELMCATEENLDEKGFYGPTGRNYWTGPVGECKLEAHALDKSVAERLWNLSEKETNFKWSL